MGGCFSLSYRYKQDLHGNTFSHYSLTSETSCLDPYPTVRSTSSSEAASASTQMSPEWRRSSAPLIDEWGQINLQEEEEEDVEEEEKGCQATNLLDIQKSNVSEPPPLFGYEQFSPVGLDQEIISVFCVECGEEDCCRMTPDNPEKSASKATHTFLMSLQPRFSVLRYLRSVLDSVTRSGSSRTAGVRTDKACLSE